MPEPNGIMVHAQYLTSDENIRGGAAELFLRHRDDIIEEKGYEGLPNKELIRDKSEYPTFHLNWIEGIVTSCLKILNHAGAVAGDLAPPITPNQPPQPGPIFDPTVAFNHISKNPAAGVAPPPATIANIIKYFGLPGDIAGGKQTAATEMGLVKPAPPADPVMSAKVAAFDAEMATITSGPQYQKRNPDDFIPSVPSDEFADLNYGESELSVKSKQELLFTSVVNAFDELVIQIKASPLVHLFPISTGVDGAPAKPNVGQQKPGPGLIPIFTAAELALNKAVPDPTSSTDENAISNIVNFEALKRFLIKPLYLAAIGVVFGSSEIGFVNLMGDVVPDAIKTLNSDSKFPDPKPLRLTSDQQESQNAESNEIQDFDDGARNNVPINRNRLVVEKRFLNVGTGIKNEIYQRIKEIGSRFISSGEANDNADDNHKGLTVMCVLFHETGMDPGAGNRKNPGGQPEYIGYSPTDQFKTTDALIWGGNIAITGKIATSLTKRQFQTSPIMDPNGSSVEQGMDLMKQFEYYEEFLTRNLAVMGAKFVGTNELLMSGGRRGVTVGFYHGPDPHVENNLRGPLRQYLSLRNDERTETNKKEDGHILENFLPEEFGGKKGKGASGHYGYKEPRYYMQTPYDLYGFHQGVTGAGDLFVRANVGDDAEKKHIILYTMAVRNIEGMAKTNEHIPRYMNAVGMSSIDWKKVGVVGFSKYVGSTGETFNNFPSKPSQWYSENKDEIQALIQIYNARSNLK